MKELTLRDTIPLAKYIVIVQSSHLEHLTDFSQLVPGSPVCVGIIVPSLVPWFRPVMIYISVFTLCNYVTVTHELI